MAEDAARGTAPASARGTGEPPAALPAGRSSPPRAALLGDAPATRRLREQTDRVAKSRTATVLITGESGAGKEVVARALHAASPRARGPFVALDCAAVADGLLEAELFGHEPGAFTGATPRGRDGLLAAAEGGTLLLDEVGELAPGLQAKLLRVLQERRYRRVGGRADRPFDARVLAATNRDLAALVAAGHFREDLYYRLNVLHLCVPPLRERADDLPRLSAEFLAELAAGLDREPPALAPEALARLAAHPWPGNVRELRNVLERSLLLASGPRLEAADLVLDDAAAPSSAPTTAADDAPHAACLPLGDRSWKSVERTLYERVLADEDGNRSRAARVLGIDRTTLYNKLRAWAAEDEGA